MRAVRLTCARPEAPRSLLTRWPRSITPNRRRSAAASATRVHRVSLRPRADEPCGHMCRAPQDIARARQRSPTATYDVLREAESGNLL